MKRFYLHPYEPLPFANTAYAEVDAIHMVPIWRFVGETNKGDTAEFIIPALADVELPALPTNQ